MPQYPIGPRPGGSLSTLNITATTVIKAAPGTVYRVTVNAAASAGFGVYDATATGGAVLANAILVSATTTVGTVYTLEYPCANGIVVAPGTGGNVSVSWS